MDYRYKHHALQQYSSRAAVQPHHALVELDAVLHAETTTEHGYAEVRALGFNVLHYKKGDIYKVWYNDTIKEKMCAIIRDGNNVITVLTENMYSWPTKGTKCRYDVTMKGVEM